jgi:cytochrome c553
MKTYVITSLVLMAASSAAFGAGNAAAGKEKNSMCVGCHGIPGYRTAYPETYQVPKLGGQHAEYIVDALKDYKKGDRKFSTMRAIVGDMSEQDMNDLAAYYSEGK